jgi:hypothetical protein
MRLTAGTILLLSAACLFSAAGPDFTAEVQPILKRRCSGCHGAALQMNGLRLDHGPSALKGSYSGPVILAGKAAESTLIQRVSSEKDGFRMPPAGPRLTAAEIATLKSWINSGARFPDSMMKAEAPRRETSHWSFQPVTRPNPPPVKNPAWARNAIDRFILARLEKEGIAPSHEAGRATLLRRVSLDLTGLPPSVEMQREFLADSGPHAYERIVDRLLESPHYGERWARPWLDLAHYADSDGYEKDLARPYAWRYRQWVIDAINSDMPFDEFTIQQLAGDLMPNRTTESMVATGFLRNTLTNREAGVDRDEDRFEQLVNRTNTVSTTWLGLAMGCAQCHDHKYDPLSQKDYYSLFAFFDRSREAMIDAPMPGEVGPYLRGLPGYRQKRAALLADYDVPALQKLWESYIIRSIKEPGWSPEWDFSLTSMKAMFDGAVPVLLTPPAERSETDRDRLTDYFVHRTGLAPELPKDKMERLKELRKKLEALEESTPKLTQAMVMMDDPRAAQTRIAIKGDWRRRGIPVDPDVPAMMPAMQAVSGKATRLDLARWLVSAENPLTPRVVANRAWHELFGRGIVRTNEDFGTQGEKPSHPELLDWLAAELRGNGWSMKKLHRVIVTSAAYRQASTVRADLQERDPENILMARQARLRLSAELIRDNALAVSGLLDTTVGGKSIRPPQPEGVDKLTYANNGKWMVSEGGDRYRRGLYIHFQRTAPYPMLMNFDEPDSNVACTRRARSNTALQALNLLNDEVFFEAAQALAWRVEREAGSGIESRIGQAFQLALGRAPAERERSRLARLHDELHGHDSGAAALAAVCRAILNTDEFITRE